MNLVRALYIDRTRARLAYLMSACLCICAGLAFFFGDKLNGVQISLLTMIITQIAGKAAAAFGHFFDGVPDGSPEKPTDKPAPKTPPTVAATPGGTTVTPNFTTKER